MSELIPGSDKRRATRISRRFILRVAVFSSEPLRWSYVTIRNLSASGIYFTYEKEVSLNQVLVFKIDFPDKLIECMGQVVRVERGPGGLFSNIAATFQGRSDGDRDHIERFVQGWTQEV